MSEYALTATDEAVTRTIDGAFIPNDEANRDWQDYQLWLADGGLNPGECEVMFTCVGAVLRVHDVEERTRSEVTE